MLGINLMNLKIVDLINIYTQIYNDNFNYTFSELSGGNYMRISINRGLKILINIYL